MNIQDEAKNEKRAADVNKKVEYTHFKVRVFAHNTFVRFDCRLCGGEIVKAETWASRDDLNRAMRVHHEPIESEMPF